MEIIFTTSNKPAALVIQLFTGCRWHHCGVVVGDCVIEASAIHGVRSVPLHEFMERGDWVSVIVDGVDGVLTSKFLHSQIGKGYDIFGAISLPFRRDWQDKSRWYCSELTAAAACAGGVKIVRDGLKSVTPRDLYVQNFKIKRRRKQKTKK